MKRPLKFGPSAELNSNNDVYSVLLFAPLCFARGSLGGGGRGAANTGEGGIHQSIHQLLGFAKAHKQIAGCGDPSRCDLPPSPARKLKKRTVEFRSPLGLRIQTRIPTVPRRNCRCTPRNTKKKKRGVRRPQFSVSNDDGHDKEIISCPVVLRSAGRSSWHGVGLHAHADRGQHRPHAIAGSG